MGSFVDAAKVLHVTAAAISLLVRELEREVGFRLLHRSTRRVSLTEQGQQLLEHVDRLLGNLRMVDLVAQEIRHQGVGVVRIAMTPLMQLALLPPMMEAFQRQWPQIHVELVDVPSELILQRLLAGESDLAIAFETRSGDELEGVPLFSSRLHVVLKPDHRLALKKSVAWSDLKSEQLLFIGKGTELRVRARLPASIRLASGYEASSSTGAVALVASGNGVAIAPAYVRQLCSLHQLKVLPLTGPVIRSRFMLYRRQANFRSPAVTTFEKFLLDYFTEVHKASADIDKP